MKWCFKKSSLGSSPKQFIRSYWGTFSGHFICPQLLRVEETQHSELGLHISPSQTPGWSTQPQQFAVMWGANLAYGSGWSEFELAGGWAKDLVTHNAGCEPVHELVRAETGRWIQQQIHSCWLLEGLGSIPLISRTSGILPYLAHCNPIAMCLPSLWSPARMPNSAQPVRASRPLLWLFFSLCKTCSVSSSNMVTGLAMLSLDQKSLA